ncbi:GAP family protein [Mycobacterium sp. 236(2023)]|uniref:GAP family protein n=1 Tax=Mycobacterium sp. 236(2023) TaxID=3038163 RepID=UPI0024150BEB|nr:GAP family protein [Mycobacterium sp. 236(2023)]MDG4666660.1 GAP family protein [Mycobacterium sp. 236(2023)]
MSDELSTLLAQLIPLAVMVAWSPVRILPPLALAFGAARPRATSLAYLVGSVGSLVAATAVFIGTPHLLGDFEWSTGSAGAWFRIGLGVLLIVLAGYVWTKRGRTRRSVAWLSGLTRITPTVAAALAVSLTILNPKVMVATAAAGLVIGTAALGSAGTAAAVGGYTALAGSTVIVPVVGFMIAAERADAVMTAVRLKAVRHQTAIAAAVLAALGVAIVTTGLIVVFP